MERGRGKERDRKRGTWGEGEGKERMMEMGRGKTQTGRQTETERQRQRYRDRDNLADTTAKLNLYSMSFVKKRKEKKRKKRNCEQSCSIGEHWTVCLSIYVLYSLFVSGRASASHMIHRSPFGSAARSSSILPSPSSSEISKELVPSTEQG